MSNYSSEDKTSSASPPLFQEKVSASHRLGTPQSGPCHAEATPARPLPGVELSDPAFFARLHTRASFIWHGFQFSSHPSGPAPWFPSKQPEPRSPSRFIILDSALAPQPAPWPRPKEPSQPDHAPDTRPRPARHTWPHPRIAGQPSGRRPGSEKTFWLHAHCVPHRRPGPAPSPQHPAPRHVYIPPRLSASGSAPNFSRNDPDPLPVGENFLAPPHSTEAALRPRPFLAGYHPCPAPSGAQLPGPAPAAHPRQRSARS